jgi:hypothetical protein
MTDAMSLQLTVQYFSVRFPVVLQTFSICSFMTDDISLVPEILHSSLTKGHPWIMVRNGMA